MSWFFTLNSSFLIHPNHHWTEYMFDRNSETIAAIATASGAGGIAIVRVSGGKAADILEKLFIPARPRECFSSRRLTYGRAVGADGETLDEAMAVLMRAPATYTREDVAEIHCHGGGAAASAVLSRALELGARMAMPGEFTKRAFLNGRVDLARAEAVMQLIGAQGQAAARASVRQLEGGVSAFVKRWRRRPRPKRWPIRSPRSSAS